MKEIKFGNVRVQLLSEDIVRIEYAKDGKFCDENTFFIPDRSQYEDNPVSCSREGNTIKVGGCQLNIPLNGKSLSGVTLSKNGKTIYKYKKLKNSGELPAPDKTPAVFAISDTPRILIPKGGYSVERKGEYTVEENIEDIYLLLCAKDAKKLRKLYVGLTGKPELVRLSTLGGWNSKYYAYNEEEAKQLILDYEKHNVPLDVMVIDTDWRSCEHGWGYDVNEKLFPDMKRFLDFAHAHGVEVCFNDHPEPVNGAQVFAPDEIAYREKNLQSLMEKGLDIWWYDRNWNTALVSPTSNVRWETLGMYLFEDITRHFYQKQADSEQIYRRPVIMGNAVNIANGCYQGILDSASHRYSVQWTGDIQSEPESLAQEIANMLKCGNNGIAYANADCGGHLGNPDKDGFIRWMQFGTLSPVFRPHCANSVSRYREPWAYDEETLEIVREYNKLRYRLLPVIYKNAYENYVTGEPVFKALAYEYPADKKAVKLNDEYMLGNDILIKPIVGKVPQVVQSKQFLKPVRATYYNGTELKGEPIATAEYPQLNIVLNHTSPERGVPVYNFSARFETEVMFEEDTELIVRSDDGVTVWIDGEKVFEDKTLHGATNFPLNVIEGGKPHKVEIEYFQAGGEAAIVLLCNSAELGDSVYLPEGKWLDVFNGKIYRGGKSVKREYGLHEMPIFVRMGALLPLAYNAQNTKEQKWDKLVYDFYPFKEACDSGYLYEDDGESTAYKYGQYRKCAYNAHFDREENAFEINFNKAEGDFSGARAVTERNAAIRVHLIDGLKIARVTVNGNDAPVKLVQSGGFPFGTDATPDGNCAVVNFIQSVDEVYTVKVYIK